jgi:hypothetical protein
MNLIDTICLNTYYRLISCAFTKFAIHLTSTGAFSFINFFNMLVLTYLAKKDKNNNVCIINLCNIMHKYSLKSFKSNEVNLFFLYNVSIQCL